MEHQLTIYNTLDRKKELFIPLHAPHVGMYVCGPTVYGDAHLGHARPAITFDVLFRYLTHLGYKVRYVRNITDVGHVEHDADDGEDKIAKKARLATITKHNRTILRSNPLPAPETFIRFPNISVRSIFFHITRDTGTEIICARNATIRLSAHRLHPVCL